MKWIFLPLLALPFSLVMADEVASDCNACEVRSYQEESNKCWPCEKDQACEDEEYVKRYTKSETRCEPEKKKSDEVECCDSKPPVADEGCGCDYVRPCNHALLSYCVPTDAIPCGSGCWCEPGKLQPNRLYAAPLYHYVMLNNQGVGTFKGNAWGGEVGYEYMVPMGLYALGSVNGSWSKLNQKNGSATIRQKEAFANVQLGYTAAAYGWEIVDFYLVLFTGYSYHYLNEKQKVPGTLDTTFIFKMPFIPLGFKLYVMDRDHFVLGLNYQYQFDLDPIVKISTLRGAYWALNRHSDQFAEVDFIFKWCNYDIRFSPYWRNSSSGPSTAVTSSGTSLGLQEQKYDTFGALLEFSAHF
ncbi:MAG: hypothetical protein S4CHLAM102_06060 [Chlamydiia bacterium]|nr:hypothetical protein [Chlamydiia bacterium]